MGRPFFFFSPFDHSRLSPATGQHSCSIPSFLSHCSALGTRAVRRPGNSSRNSNPERSEPRNPLLVRQYAWTRADGKSLHARGMAPVEREISNLVMDKRLLESQFFVCCHGINRVCYCRPFMLFQDSSLERELDKEVFLRGTGGFWNIFVKWISNKGIILLLEFRDCCYFSKHPLHLKKRL